MARSDLRDFFSQGYDLFVGIQGGSVLQAVDLRVDLAGDFGVTVADGDGEDASEEIKIFFALEVPEVLHFAAIDNQGLLEIVGHRRPKILFVFGYDVLAAR